MNKTIAASKKQFQHILSGIDFQNRMCVTKSTGKINAKIA